MQGSRCFVSPSPQTPSYSRRHTSRIETPDGVWVYWRCNGVDDVSRVRDLGAGGLSIATPGPQPVGMKAKLDFLVQEGQIRTEAIVRHIEPGNGLGLKFTAVTEQDSPHFAALLTRLRTQASKKAASMLRGAPDRVCAANRQRRTTDSRTPASPLELFPGENSGLRTDRKSQLF